MIHLLGAVSAGMYITVAQSNHILIPLSKLMNNALIGLCGEGCLRFSSGAIWELVFCIFHVAISLTEGLQLLVA